MFPPDLLYHSSRAIDIDFAAFCLKNAKNTRLRVFLKMYRQRTCPRGAMRPGIIINIRAKIMRAGAFFLKIASFSPRADY